MSTYTLCKMVIQNGKYRREEMMTQLDVFFLNNRINQSQYEELLGLMG